MDRYLDVEAPAVTRKSTREGIRAIRQTKKSHKKYLDKHRLEHSRQYNTADDVNGITHDAEEREFNLYYRYDEFDDWWHDDAEWERYFSDEYYRMLMESQVNQTKHYEKYSSYDEYDACDYHYMDVRGFSL